jgi:hypothetical protein
VKFRLDTPSRRLGFAIGASLLLHALILWGPNIKLPRFHSSMPAMTVRLEALPVEAEKHKRKTKTVARGNVPTPSPPPFAPEKITPLGTSTPASASVPAVANEAFDSTTKKATDRPPLPKHAQLTFSINKGTSNFRIGETIHTLDIDNGRYVLRSATKTAGLARIFKSDELTQNSSGNYSQNGLQPELFTEERTDKLGTQRYAMELDHEAQRARFSNGVETALPPETQDMLSILYQPPPLRLIEVTSAYIGNGRKIERYEFEIATFEKIDTDLGQLLTVHLRKIHGPNEEGFEIWLAQEYRLLPVKIRFTEKNGEVSGEAVITDIRVSEEQGVRKDAVN